MSKRLILFLSLLIFIFLFEAPALGAIWRIETVDSVGTVGQYTSIALDSNNNPHISYRDATKKDLKYASWEAGTGWNIQTAEASGNAYYTSIALDSSNNPHISYYNGTYTNLKYASWEAGTGWNIQAVDSAGDVGKYTSIALESSTNYPHISYRDDAYNYDLKYAKWTGTSWTWEAVDTTGDVGFYTSIALDSNNNPHISYFDNTNDDLKYASWEAGTGWIIQTVEATGSVGHATSIALDSSNNPHISYCDGSTFSLKYAKWTGTTWEIETVDFVGEFDYSTSIALESSTNYPHISYHDDADIDLKYAKWTGTTWEIETVDSAGAVGRYNSIALDKSTTPNIPHISYFSDSGANLKYATLGGEISCTVYNVTSGFLVTCEAYQGVTLQGGAGGTGFGTYTISNLLPGTYSVECWAQGYLPISKVAVVPTGETAYLTFNMVEGWPMFKQDRWHTGNSPDTEISPPLKRKWSYTTGDDVLSSPSIANGKIFVGSKDTKIYALNENTGAFIWSYTTGDRVYSSPAVVNGKVFAGSYDNNVYALNENTGAFIWSRPTGNDVYYFSSPSVANGKVFIGSFNGKIYAINENTGAIIWVYDTLGPVGSSPLVAGGRVFFGSADSLFRTLDENTGDFIWSYDAGDAVDSSPSVANGKVFFGSGDTNVYAFNENTGAFIWSYNTDNWVHSPSVANGKVFVGTNDDNFYALDENSGTFIWSYTTGDWNRPSPAIVNGWVFVGSSNDKIYVLDENSGAFIWSYATGLDVESSPSVANGRMFVGSDDGKVYAFETAVPTPESITPTQEASGTTVLATIEGHFYDGACSVTPEAKLVKGLDVINGIVTSFSTNEITCQFTLTAVGTWDVVVTNKPNEKSGTLVDAFEIFSGDVLHPIITNVKFNGRVYVEDDIISPLPLITATITDESGSMSWIKITVGEDPVYEAGPFTSPHELSYQLEQGERIGHGTHTIRINAWDPSDNIGTKECIVKVIGGPVQVIGPVLSYPPVFKPLTGGEGQRIATMAYTLSADANVTIYMYDTSGKVIKTWKRYAGSEGGRAGYNAIEWNGVTDFGGIVGNGIYVYKIVSGNKAIGTGKLVVLD